MSSCCNPAEWSHQQSFANKFRLPCHSSWCYELLWTAMNCSIQSLPTYSRSMAISGTSPTMYQAHVRPMSGDMKAKYGLIWYSSSILGSWNSHWPDAQMPLAAATKSPRRSSEWSQAQQEDFGMRIPKAMNPMQRPRWNSSLVCSKYAAKKKAATTEICLAVLPVFRSSGTDAEI